MLIARMEDLPRCLQNTFTVLDYFVPCVSHRGSDTDLTFSSHLTTILPARYAEALADESERYICVGEGVEEDAEDMEIQIERRGLPLDSQKCRSCGRIYDV